MKSPRPLGRIKNMTDQEAGGLLIDLAARWKLTGGDLSHYGTNGISQERKFNVYSSDEKGDGPVLRYIISALS